MGGGSTATSFLAQLIELLDNRVHSQPWRILVFEPSKRLGPGGPYAEDLSTNLLNIPAGKMSAYANDRGHFLRWVNSQSSTLLEQHGVVNTDPAAFLPRPLFGLYLTEVWTTLLQRAARVRIEIKHIPTDVRGISLAPENSDTLLDTPMGQYRARRTVLCNGNLPSTTFPELTSRPGYFNTPYPAIDLARNIPHNAKVAVLGTSLSAIDAIIALKENGHQTPLLAVSRNGRLPSVRTINSGLFPVNAPTLQEITSLADNQGGSLTLQSAFSFIQQRLVAAGGELDWEDVLGQGDHPHDILNKEITASTSKPRVWQNIAISLNEIIEHIWRLLPESEKQIFNSKWRSLWMARRATFPMKNALKIKHYIDANQLRIAAGFVDCQPCKDTGGYTITLNDAQGEVQTHQVQYVVNATSFSTNVSQTDVPLMRSLILQGLAVPDPYGGVRLDFDSGCLINAEDKIVSNISLMGSLAAGTYFWTTSLDVNSRLAYQQAKRIAETVPHLACVEST
ncbi:FAD/NAD(P)-binding protein [Alcaligenaceae bacterium]|nr:FAD/NAD(P)-binding protein [Alcaligenaceae bacterium]